MGHIRRTGLRLVRYLAPLLAIGWLTEAFQVLFHTCMCIHTAAASFGAAKAPWCTPGLVLALACAPPPGPHHPGGDAAQGLGAATRPQAPTLDSCGCHQHAVRRHGAPPVPWPLRQLRPVCTHLCWGRPRLCCILDCRSATLRHCKVQHRWRPCQTRLLVGYPMHRRHLGKPLLGECLSAAATAPFSAAQRQLMKQSVHVGCAYSR